MFFVINVFAIWHFNSNLDTILYDTEHESPNVHVAKPHQKVTQ